MIQTSKEELRALVAGCLCRLCQTTEPVPARADSLHKDALQYALGRKTSLVPI